MPYSVYSPESEAQIAQLNAITKKYFEKTLKEIVYEESVLFSKIKNGNKISFAGGNQFQWPVRIAKLGTAAAVDPRASVSWSTADTRIAATLNFKYYYATTLIQWDELAKNQGEPQIIDLVKDKVQELKQDMMDQMITDVYADAGGDEMNVDSLNDLVGTTTYAGINPSGLADATRWQSKVYASQDVIALYENEIGAAETGTSLAKAINAATFGKERPDLIITSREIYDFLDYVGGEKVRVPDKNTLDLGFDNIKFKGIPVVADPACPDGTVYGLNMNEIALKVHSDYDFKPTEWKPHESYPNALFKGLSFAGNLMTKTRHTHFKISGISGYATGAAT